MTQKVLRVGSSAAVTIPKKSLEELGLKIGDMVFVLIDHINQRVIVGKNKPKDLNIISKRELEVLNWTRRFIQRYRKDLEALAKK